MWTYVFAAGLDQSSFHQFMQETMAGWGSQHQKDYLAEPDFRVLKARVATSGKRAQKESPDSPASWACQAGVGRRVIPETRLTFERQRTF